MCVVENSSNHNTLNKNPLQNGPRTIFVWFIGFDIIEDFQFHFLCEAHSLLCIRHLASFLILHKKLTFPPFLMYIS